MSRSDSSSTLGYQIRHFFIYFAIMVSVIVLFKPGGDGPLPFPQADKVIHALTFALLALGMRWRILSWKVIFVSLASYAALSELIQRYFVPGREFDLVDITADLSGVIFILIWVMLSKLSSRAVGRRTREL